VKKVLVSMILVGGKGTRLKEITKDTAKPAVSFGAKYRMIDFTLSNIANSNIDVVGLITQYEPFELMSYIGRGASWDLDVLDGGIFFLTPYTKNGNILWQQGTAHAVKQYFDFIREYDADYVLILSGDQIYKMDYRDMLQHHLEHHSMITIAATPIDITDASRFGIIETDESERMVGFEEKPTRPLSNLASMGAYIFNANILEMRLSDTSANESVDFGKDIIPQCLAKGDLISVYTHHGYWRDIGTVESLFQANMDMIDNPDFLDLNKRDQLPVYSKSLNLPPHMVTDSGLVQNSCVADGCMISGTVLHSTVGYQTVIMQGAEIRDVVVLPNVVISENVHLQNVIVNKDLIVPKNYRLLAKEITVLDSTNIGKLGDIDE